MIRQLLLTWLLSLFLVPLFTVMGQDKVHVMEKVLNKKIPIEKNEIIKVSGEKADISILSWNKDFIELKLTFTAKHQDKSLAEKELQYMKYSISKESNILEIANSFVVPEGVTRLHSKVGVTVQLWIPENSKISIIDKYGNINVSGKHEVLEILNDFGDIQLNSVSGKINIQNSYGEVRGNDISGSLICKGNKSFIQISDLKAKCQFNSSYGKIDLDILTSEDITIKSNRTPILISLKNGKGYNFDLHTTHSAINVPDVYKNTLKKNINGQESFYLTQKSNSPLIKINTTYSSITIKN